MCAAIRQCGDGVVFGSRSENVTSTARLELRCVTFRVLVYVHILISIFSYDAAYIVLFYGICLAVWSADCCAIYYWYMCWARCVPLLCALPITLFLHVLSSSLFLFLVNLYVTFHT